MYVEQMGFNYLDSFGKNLKSIIEIEFLYLIRIRMFPRTSILSFQQFRRFWIVKNGSTFRVVN